VHIVINWALLRTTLQRYVTHALLIVVVVSAIGLSQFEVVGFQLVLPKAALAAGPETAGTTRGLLAHAYGGPAADASIDTLVRQAESHTDIPARPRRDIITYTVQAGDTPLSIAKQFGLDPRTILWGNPGLASNAEILQIGEVLNILPVDGVLHEVTETDTLDAIAATYKVDPSVIINYSENQVGKDGKLTAGQQLVVPGGQRDMVWTQPVVTVSTGSSNPSGSYYTGPVAGSGLGNFIWPLSGYLSQYFWWGHSGIDIAIPTGTPIAASDSGTVIFSGWNTGGYGNLVVIDHGNGFQTYYAHQSLIAVENGQWVGQGEVIGYSGSTGRSTGPHLHFEIRYNGHALDPLAYLP
jgi:LysM repeat protein